MRRLYIRMPYLCFIAISEAITMVMDCKALAEVSMTSTPSLPTRQSCPHEASTGMMEVSGKTSISTLGLLVMK